MYKHENMDLFSWGTDGKTADFELRYLWGGIHLSIPKNSLASYRLNSHYLDGNNKSDT